MYFEMFRELVCMYDTTNTTVCKYILCLNRIVKGSLGGILMVLGVDFVFK